MREPDSGLHAFSHNDLVVTIRMELVFGTRIIESETDGVIFTCLEITSPAKLHGAGGTTGGDGLWFFLDALQPIARARESVRVCGR